MGAGVSLSLTQNGFPVRHLVVGSDPFARELVLSIEISYPFARVVLKGDPLYSGSGDEPLHYQKWVSLPQKGKYVDGGHFSSRDMAMSRSSLSKKRPFCASGVDADADPAVDDDVTGQASRPCRASKSVYADPTGTNSTEADQVRSGKTGAAVSGEIIVCVAADVNADYSVA